MATGALGWSPDSFWHSTPDELWDAIEGYRQANTADGANKGPMTEEEIEAQREMMRRFPDGPVDRSKARKITSAEGLKNILSNALGRPAG